jgi:hypothetical protein
MSSPLSSSRHDATDRVSPGRESLPPRRRNGAGRWALAVLVGWAALFVVAPAASALPPTGIKGTVTDSSAHTPISGAEVCAVSNGGGGEKVCEHTGANGEYKIETLKAEEYKLEFSAPQHEAKTQTVTVAANELKEVNAELKEVGEGSVTGRVTSASSGQGAGGVEVCSDESRHCVETNGNGEYTISGLSVGSHTIFFSSAETCEEEQGEKIHCQAKSNYIGRSSSVNVKVSPPATLDVALQVGGQIGGTVTNASITHPELAKVEVCATRVTGPEEYGRRNCAFTSSNGQYTINSLENGFYKVEFNGFICSIPKKGHEECPEVYITQYYHGQQTFKKGETVSVTTGANTGGINETLREAFPTTPAGTAAPTLTGTPAVGQALTCSQGSWSHEPTYLVYQWLRNGTVITGQTASTYTLQAADQGHTITCSVTAGNGAGAASATSNAVPIPVPLVLFAGVKVKGAVASVTVRCPGPGSCSGVLRIVARVVGRHGKRKKTSSVTIGVASFSMAAGKRVTLHVLLTGQGRKLLNTVGRLGLKVQITGSGVQAHTAKLKPAPRKRRR